MARNTKWIESRPEETVGQIASRAIELRLQRMWIYLERSVEQPSEIENVHQLRVFARRATAALDIFADWLPARAGKKLRKRVKRVRQAAGGARDLDVLDARLRSQPGATTAESMRLVLEQIAEHRRLAQQPIEEVFEQLGAKRFVRKLRKLAKRVRRGQDVARRPQRFDDMAHLALAELVGPYLQAAQAELADDEALHAFRIQGKQVRYAMEIFAGVFDAEFRQDLYPVVATLQDRLGAINDHVTAEGYFARWRDEATRPELREALQNGIDSERRLLDETRQQFLEWWNAWRRDDLTRRFGRYVPLERFLPQRPAIDEAG